MTVSNIDETKRDEILQKKNVDLFGTQVITFWSILIILLLCWIIFHSYKSSLNQNITFVIILFVILFFCFFTKTHMYKITLNLIILLFVTHWKFLLEYIKKDNNYRNIIYHWSLIVLINDFLIVLVSNKCDTYLNEWLSVFTIISISLKVMICPFNIVFTNKFKHFNQSIFVLLNIIFVILVVQNLYFLTSINAEINSITTTILLVINSIIIFVKSKIYFNTVIRISLLTTSNLNFITLLVMNNYKHITYINLSIVICVAIIFFFSIIIFFKSDKFSLSHRFNFLNKISFFCVLLLLNLTSILSIHILVLILVDSINKLEYIIIVILINYQIKEILKATLIHVVYHTECNDSLII